MFLIDKPYVSEFFKKTVKDFNIPIVDTESAKKFTLYEGTSLVNEDTAIKQYKNNPNTSIYTISENSIGWISQHLSHNDLPDKIDLFKDKFKFRELTKTLFPDFYYKKISSNNFTALNFDEVPLPFIIKPTVGFFSMGVYKVSSHHQWLNTIDLINAEMLQIKDLYPQQVMGTSDFIIEQIIEGEEFAIDAYFNAEGEAVIVGIFKHVFSSDTDVSDRVYITSEKIIKNNLQEFTVFINKIGALSGVKNFPVHIELRRDIKGNLLPIEVNPMRFGGWCTTADVTYLAYGFNPYQYYYSQLKPNWPELLKDKEGKLFSIIVLDNSSGIEDEIILSFDYEKLQSNFESPLELRKINYKNYPVFGFLFTETRDNNFSELINILNSDLKEFITIRK
ncbi:MAG: ATP-grasp domain-containing protein [Gammaproteobacteria bacterium]|nr:ATP-grasp domain-containing protein [Gammaproteobacteria bacterium]